MKPNHAELDSSALGRRLVDQGMAMDTDSRFYARRAAEEFGRAKQAVTTAGQDRHRKLAQDFAARPLKAAEAEELAKLEC